MSSFIDSFHRFLNNERKTRQVGPNLALEEYIKTSPMDDDLDVAISQYENLLEIEMQWFWPDLKPEDCYERVPIHRDVIDDIYSRSRPAFNPGDFLGNYKLLGRIGKGGFGEVWTAFDDGTKRIVAIKLPKTSRYKKTEEDRRRFRVEAEALGQLRHENIAVIHTVGEIKEGQPYIVMEFVEGAKENEKALNLVEFCEDLSMPNRIALFKQVCDAMAYSHSRNVYHRDISPANILVEVRRASKESGNKTLDRFIPKIIDFGLSEKFSPKEESEYRKASSIGGTQGYIAPERFSPLCTGFTPPMDVYSLGRVLNDLTRNSKEQPGRKSLSKRGLELSQPVASPADSLVRLSLKRRVVRLLNRFLPHALAPRFAGRAMSRMFTNELNHIVKKATHPEPTNRYASCAEFSADLNRLLNNQPISADFNTPWYRYRKQFARNPLANILSMGLVCTLLIGSFIWTQRLREVDRRKAEDQIRIARAMEGLKALLPNAESLIEKGDVSKAALLVEQANRYAEDVSPRLLNRLEKLRDGLSIIRRLEKVEVLRWRSDRRRDADIVAELRLAFLQSGIEVEERSISQASRTISSSTAKNPLISALDRWLARGGDKTVLSILELVDSDPFRTKLRRAVAQKGLAVEDFQDQRDWRLQPTSFLIEFQKFISEELDTRKLLLKQRLAEEPDNFDLLVCLSSNSATSFAESADAIRYCQAAVALRPSSPVALNGLGIALTGKNETDAAIKIFTRAIESNPLLADLHNNFGIVLKNAGDYTTAERELERAIELSPERCEPYYSLGNLFSEQSRLEEAISKYRESIKRDESYALAYIGLAKALAREGKFDEAIANYDLALSFEPDNPDAYCGKANALSNEGRFDEAIRVSQKGIELAPNSPELYEALGFAFRQKRDFRSAAVAFEHSAKTSVGEKRAAAYYLLGETYFLLNEEAQAKEALNQAIAINPSFAECHFFLACLQMEAGHFDEAVQAYLKAFEFGVSLSGFDQSTLNMLVTAFEKSPKHQGSSVSLGKLLKKLTDDIGQDNEQTVRVQWRLGKAHLLSGDHDRGTEVLRQVFEFTTSKGKSDRKHGELLEELATLLFGCGHFALAEEMLKESISIEDKQRPISWRKFGRLSKLGEALVKQQKSDEAEKFLLDGYEGLLGKKKTIPKDRAGEIPDALRRLVDFYELVSNSVEAERYRGLLSGYLLDSKPEDIRKD